MAGKGPRGEACEGGDERTCGGEQDGRRAPEAPNRTVSIGGLVWRMPSVEQRQMNLT